MVTIAEVFTRAKQEKRLALVGYLPAGYPDARGFIELSQHAFSAGLDVLEIGLPTTDPKYDGDVIRLALRQVMEQGVSTKTALELGEQALQGTRGAGTAMFYTDTLSSYGSGRLFLDCIHAGISGLLPVGIEYPDWQPFAAAASENGLSPIGFITFEMDLPSMQCVVERAGGFLYLQSQSGPTGQQGEFGDELRQRVAQVKALAANRLPVAVGFGIKNPADVEDIRSIGPDGVIVGTAFVEAAAQGVSALEDLVYGLAEAARKS